MENKHFMVLLLIIYSITVIAQKKTDSNIYGHVIDTKTKEHIPYINVSVKGTTIGTATDNSGHYYLKNLPVGKLIVVASGLGYKTVEKEIVTKKGQTQEVNFYIIEDHIMLDGIVVSANRNETNRRESSTIVNIISPKTFEKTNSVCLAQGLNFQPGLRVETNCQNCGFQQVRINGLDGPYSQILIDSRPVFSSLAGVYGIEQIPANMIERVEVVRGGGSALFGSNAIAGTVNIITREPVINSVTLSNTTTSIYGESTDINTSANASVVSDNLKTGVIIFGSTRQRGSFDYNNDGFSEISKINGKNIGFKTFYKPGSYSKLMIEYHNLGEFRRGGNCFDRPPHEADIAEQTDHNINTGGISYDILTRNFKHRIKAYSSAQHIDRKSYYGAQKDLYAYGLSNDLTFISGIQYSYSIDTLLFMPAEFTCGAEYNVNELTDEMPGYNRVINQSVNTKSVFLQNEWKNKDIGILLGGRIDKHNLIVNPIFSPRISLRYYIKKNIAIRAGYATGFRAPQAFDEDLHITAVGGEVILIQLSPDLKTENSKNFSASFDIYKDFGNIKTNFLFEGFYTELNNVFVLEELGTNDQGNIVLERGNGAGAVVQGVNIEGKVVPTDNVQFQFGFTFQKSIYKEVQRWSDNENLRPQNRMFRTPNKYGYLTLDYHVLKDFSIALSGTYTGSMLVQHFAGYIAEDVEKHTPDFYDFNIKIFYDIWVNTDTKLQFNTGMQNIFNSYQNDFDTGEFRDAGYIYGPSLPRSFFLGIKIVV